MLRFFRNQLASPEVHDDTITDYVDFKQTVRHGFPSRVSSFAYDDVLSLLAVGTHDGDVQIYGGKNVMWTGEVHGRKGIGRSVCHMYFAKGYGVLIVLCRDSTFVRFRIEGSKLSAESIVHESRLKKITSCCMLQGDELRETRLLIGTVSGNVFSLVINTLELTEFIVFDECILPRLTEGGRRDKYSVDILSICPTDTKLIVMVLDHFILLTYRSSTNVVLGSSILPHCSESISWTHDGTKFLLALRNGSYSIYNKDNLLIYDTSAALFGPYPCMPLKQVYFADLANSVEPIVLFGGGMPHASYGDRHVVTAKQGERICVFDFASPVIDFLLTTEKTCNGLSKNTCALILTDNEIVCLDLTDRFWKTVPVEQLFPLHATPITTTNHCCNIDEHVWKLIVKTSEEQYKRNVFYSTRPWPLTAGSDLVKEGQTIKDAPKRQLFLTGHENGTVRVWSAGHITMKLLFVIDTAREFEGYINEEDLTAFKDSVIYDTDSSDERIQMNGEWPPFRKVGDYDPFCDDSRLAIQKLAIDNKSGQIVIGGRGGHVLLYSMEEEAKELQPTQINIELIESEKLSTAIKNVTSLKPRVKPAKYGPGYQPYSIDGNNSSFLVQLSPPTAISAVSLLSSRNLVSAANEYGYILIDVTSRSILRKNSLISYNDLPQAGTIDDALSRFKSMKQSIRQTFRRKKKTPVVSLDNTIGTVNSDTAPESVNGNISKVFSDDDDVDIVKPVERKIEERGSSLESPTWLIRCLHFLNIPVGTGGNCDVFLVGTNGGRVLTYTITDQPRAEDVCKPLRVISLRHGAPLIHIDVAMEPGPKNIAVPRLLLFTEEQVRSFSLPNLKPTKYKFKLTSTEGLRIRKAAIVTLHNSRDLTLTDSFAAIMNNQGEIAIYSLNNPKRRLKYPLVKSTDIVGISSTIITPYGELFFLRPGGSELQRATISEHSQHWSSPFEGKQWPEPLGFGENIS